MPDAKRRHCFVAVAPRNDDVDVRVSPDHPLSRMMTSMGVSREA
jgi:hypothetical protein